MSQLDKTIRVFFEASIVAFATVAILSTTSIVDFSNKTSVIHQISSGEIENETPVEFGSEIEWHQIEDKMVPVEFIEFPPLHVSVGTTNMLYND